MISWSPPMLLRLAKSAWNCQRGNVAIIFAFASIPVVGISGGAVDYVILTRDVAALQAVYDAASLAAVKESANGPTATAKIANDHVRGQLPTRLAAIPYTVTVSADARTATVATNGATIDTVFLGILGLPKLNINVKSTAVATVQQITTINKPVLLNLTPEAGDYNRLYAYCYNDSQRNQANKGRSQMTILADNAGTSYPYTMPVCGANETVSYRLYNVRNARASPSLWDSPQSASSTYNYHSDTRLQNGIMTHQFEKNVSVLETIICDTLSQCRDSSQGGIIPTGKNRTPLQATKPCTSGKYFYLGWEDRPPLPYEWSDADYDDVRVVMECPTTQSKVISIRLVE